jgi:hypothetical protein
MTYSSYERKLEKSKNRLKIKTVHSFNNLKMIFTKFRARKISI